MGKYIVKKRCRCLRDNLIIEDTMGTTRYKCVNSKSICIGNVVSILDYEDKPLYTYKKVGLFLPKVKISLDGSPVASCKICSRQKNIEIKIRSDKYGDYELLGSAVVWDFEVIAVNGECRETVARISKINSSEAYTIDIVGCKEEFVLTLCTLVENVCLKFR